MDNIFLVGSEDVQRAGSQISAAADNMKRAADSFDCSIERLKNMLEEYVSRFEQAVEKINNKP